MSNGSIILVGGPASGKTNYIGRLWLSFAARKGKLRAEQLPTNIEYVNAAVRHLQTRKFAPRSDKNMEEGGRRDFTIQVRAEDGAGSIRDLTVPDITGELWSKAIKSYELPEDWAAALNGSASAILFVRAHSKFNIQPMDWVTARDHLQDHDDEDDEEDIEDDDADYGADEDEDGDPIEGDGQPAQGDAIPPGENIETVVIDVSAGQPTEADDNGDDAEDANVIKKRDILPAQVGFCELLRYLSLLMADRDDGGKPRVAVVVTAWDTLDGNAKAAGPMKYLDDQFPMFAGRIKTPGRLDIEVFGMSIVGGNLRGPTNKAFRDSLKGIDLSEVGYTAVMRDGSVVEDPDVTLPLAWALGD